MKSKKRNHLLYAALPAFALCAAGTSYAKEPASQGRVEEIVVTAQRRSENLQKVPVTIVALTANSALALAVHDTTDIQVATPGLIMHHQTNALTPSLNGITSVNAAPGDESPVAVYVDGVYYAAATSALFAFNNIERLEVEKGPQGTLFGRNAVGGVLQIITKRPQQTPELDLSVGFGNYNRGEASLYATTGITPEIATDLAVHWDDQYKGWGHDVYTGADVFTNRDFSVSNKWLFTPSENTEIIFAADYENVADPVGSAKDPLAGTFVGVPPGGTHLGGFYDLRENQPAFAKTPQWGTSIHLTQNFDWARLVSISAYRGSKPSELLDLDGIQSNYLTLQGRYNLREFTQELQLLSPDSSKVKWVGGLFYMDNTSDAVFHETGLAFGPPPAFTDILSNMLTDSFAAFGQVTAPIFEDTNLTGGLRYTVDRQKIGGGIYNINGLKAGVDQSKTFDKLTWRLAIDHQFTSDLMTYFSYNRGFKSGAYNAISPTDPAVRPSVIDAYEVGVKSQWLEGKLRANASAFYYDYNDVQLTVIAVGATHLTNAATARIKGVNLDIDAIPVKALTLRTGISYVDAIYTNLQNAPFATAKPGGGYIITPGDASGNEMIFTPKWTFNTSAQYSIPTEQGTYGVSVIYYYNGSYFPDTANQLRQPAHSLVNSSIDWTSPNDRWNVRLWGKNLTDAKYYNHITINSILAQASPSAPLTFGVTVSLKLGGG